MLTSILAAAAGLGLLGGLHCALMCGPLAIAGCSSARVRGGAAYLGGRLFAHAFAGAAFGALGTSAARALSGSLAQSALLGVVAIAALGRGATLLAPARQAPPALVTLGRGPARAGVAAFLASLLPKRALPLGLATGALPCGLLAGAWGLAAATASPAEGALAMAAFSVASAPGLIAALAVGLRVTRALARVPRAWQGALWCALGVFVGVRPLISSVHACCH